VSGVIVGFFAGIAFTILMTIAVQAYGQYKANK